MAEAQLLLLRHGIAEPRGGSGEDGLRALTQEGRDRTRRICQRLSQLGLRASTLVSSPLVRARQTADIAVEAGMAPSLLCNEALAPGADPWPLLENWWRAGSDDAPARLILVGHEPDLSQLACGLIAAPPGALVLKKAGLAVLGWDQGPSAASAFPADQARLLLLLTPRILLPT
jgi:phosphohistidine phosphatase